MTSRPAERESKALWRQSTGTCGAGARRAGPGAQRCAPPSLARWAGGAGDPESLGVYAARHQLTSLPRASPRQLTKSRSHPWSPQKTALLSQRKDPSPSPGKKRVGERCWRLLSPCGRGEGAGKEDSLPPTVKATPKESQICGLSWARSLSAEAGRLAARSAREDPSDGGSYLEMLEEGGDARDLQAEAPGGAAGALDAPGGKRLVQPPGRPRAGAGRQAAPGGRQPEAEGQGRAGRPGHHGCGSGARAPGAGRSSQLRAGAALPGTSRPPQLSWKVQSFNSGPAPSPPRPSPRCLQGGVRVTGGRVIG